jgi:SAM-dependent methyltransferase
MQAAAEAARKKSEIIEKYEREAREKDSEVWMTAGGSVRVPESKASHYFIERKVEMAFQLLDGEFGTSSAALEIGCSFGHMTPLLAARFDKLTALDISPSSVAIASKRLVRYGVANVDFLVDDAEKLEHVPDGACDVIFSFSTIRFCPNPDGAVRAACAKLRKGGVAVIDFPNPLSPWHLFIKAVAGIRRHVNDNRFSERNIVERFLRAGFDVEKKKVYLFTTKRLPSPLLPVFKAVDFVFERTPLIRRLGGIIVIKARKR